MTNLKNIRGFLGVAATLALSTMAATPAYAWDESRIHQPGTFEALMYSKLPGVYGPHLPAPVSAEHRPTGSFAAFQGQRKGLPLSTSDVAPATGRDCHAVAIDELTKPKAFRTAPGNC